MKIKRWIGVLLLCVGMLPTMALAANEVDTWDGTADTSRYTGSEEVYNINSAAAAGEEQPETTTISVSTEQEFRDAVNTANTTEGNYIFSLENDITLTGGFGNSIVLKDSKSVVTILGNGHSIISNFTGQAGLIVNPGTTLNLGLPDGSDSLTIKGGDQSLNHTLALISISVGTVNMYPGVSLQDYTNKATDATTGGGAVSVAFSGGTFNMFGGEISNCSISNTGRYNHGAGVLVRSGAVFNMYGGSISGNTQNSYGYGGGVAVTDDATFNMYGGEICNNSAPKYSTSYLGGSGGGVIISNAHFNMTGGKIYGNTAYYAGGGVYVTGDSTFIMSGEEGNEIEIYENTAIYGGGVYMQECTDAKMRNVKVYKNKAITTTYYGNCGGVYVKCPLDMTNVEIYENSSSYDCGGVYVFTNTVLNMSNVEIHDNTAAGYGGGVLLRAGAEFNALDNDVKVYGNEAQYGGGVFSYGSFTFNDGKIYKNTAVLGGGAFVAQTCNITGGEIYENTVDGAGGGVFINSGGAFNMTGGKIYKNEADEGGGVYSCGSLTKTGGVIHNNTAVSSGDDIVAVSSDNLTLDSVGEGLTLESTGQSITGWYHDGSRFTGELDGEGNPIYDETRWAVMDEEGYPYLYTYEKPDRAVSVALKAAYHIHTFGDWEDAGETQHIHTCITCGEVEYQEHDWDEWTKADSDTHTRTCEICQRVETEAHDWGSWTDDGNGNHTHTCTVEGCGAEETKEHTWGEWTKVDSDTHKHTCTDCGAEENKAHAWGEWTDDGNGNHTRTCACGAEETEEHTWGEWTKVDGDTHKHVCTICGAEKNEAHGWSDPVIVPATHLADGSEIYFCQSCGASKKETIPKTPEHTFGDWDKYDETQHKRTCACGEVEYQEHAWDNDGEGVITKQPTCNDTGVIVYTCTVCGATKTEVLPKTSTHTFGDTKTMEPTCEKAGYTYHICTVCGYAEKVADIAATEHKESDWIVDAYADCVTAGSKHKECTVCGKLLEKEEIKAEGHQFGDDITYAATCETAGYTYHICSVCQHAEKVADIKAPGHSWETECTVDVEPTCTTDGSQSIHCSVCGAVKEDSVEVVLATGHSMETGYTEDKAPTCTEKGIGHKKCSKCEHMEIIEIDALGHSWAEEYTVDVEPTCTTEGSKSIHCERCDATKDRKSISKISHTASDWIVDVQATCVTPGSQHTECTVCKQILAIGEIPATTGVHTYGDTLTHAATCEEGGYIYHVCTVCGHTEKIEEFEATGHTPSDDWQTDKNDHWKECTVCGAVLEKTGHTFGELIVDEDPTCTETGIGHRICSKCDYKEDEVIPALGHSWESEYTVDKEPTCTTEGRKSIHCERCEELMAQEDIPATGHTPSDDWQTDENGHWKVCTVCEAELEKTGHAFGELIIDEAPTCTDDGTGHRDCAICQYRKTEAIKATGHSWEKGYTVDKAPTCTEAGSESHHCLKCGAVNEESKRDIPATGHTPSEDWSTDENGHWKVCTVCGVALEKIGHTFGELTIDEDPTCAADGTGHRDCAICQYTKTEAIKATGHSWEKGYTVDKAPTCTEEGSESHHCHNCDETTDSKSIPATGHKFGDIKTYAAACETAGYTYHICDVCGYTEKVADIPATGHTFGAWEAVDGKDELNIFVQYVIRK